MIIMIMIIIIIIIIIITIIIIIICNLISSWDWNVMTISARNVVFTLGAGNVWIVLMSSCIPVFRKYRQI